jgi:L-ribulose-5-phosphate 3-epimerase
MSTLFNRRQLMCRAASCGAALWAGADWLTKPLQAQGSQLTGRIKKAIKYKMIVEKLSVADKFKLVKDLGFDGLEVRVHSMDDRRELLRASESTGIAIHGVVNSSDPDLRSAIDLAHYLGATSVLCVAGRVNEKNPYDENYRATQRLYRDAAPYAEKYQVRLLVENVWNEFLLSPLEMVRYLDEIDSPWVAAYFDVGNVVRFGWPEQWIRILGKRIIKVDVKEYSRKKLADEGLWKGLDVELGEGDVDWAAVREALRSVDFQGWATVQSKGGDRNRLADVAARMDRVLGLAK